MAGRDRAARVARQEIEQVHSLAEGAFHHEYTSAQLWRSEGGRWRGNTTSRRSWRSISAAADCFSGTYVILIPLLSTFQNFAIRLM
eukprot:COSAG01_NODE_75_length_28415_cov_72.253267_6_plen_86_part_00